MAAKKSTTTESPQQFADSANAYIERLEQGHGRYAERFATARARNARIADKFVESMMAGQRDALELTKAVTADPTAYGKNMEAIMQSMSTAQERALDAAKTLYREQAEATAELRTIAEKMFESSKGLAKPFEKMTSMWMPATK